MRQIILPIEHSNDMASNGVVTQWIGIETLGDNISKFSEIGERLPFSVSQYFSTAEDNQENITFTIYKGKNPNPKPSNSTCLGIVKIQGIQAFPKGMSKILISFTFFHTSLQLTVVEEVNQSSITVEYHPRLGDKFYLSCIDCCQVIRVQKQKLGRFICKNCKCKYEVTEKDIVSKIIKKMEPKERNTQKI